MKRRAENYRTGRAGEAKQEQAKHKQEWEYGRARRRGKTGGTRTRPEERVKPEDRAKEQAKEEVGGGKNGEGKRESGAGGRKSKRQNPCLLDLNVGLEEPTTS